MDNQPTHIIICTDKNKNLITATIAYTEQEAKEITEQLSSYYYNVRITECDYSIRNG